MKVYLNATVIKQSKEKERTQRNETMEGVKKKMGSKDFHLCDAETNLLNKATQTCNYRKTKKQKKSTKHVPKSAHLSAADTNMPKDVQTLS